MKLLARFDGIMILRNHKMNKLLENFDKGKLFL